MKKIVLLILFHLLFLTAGSVYPQIYPDQHYVIRGDSLLAKIESSDGIQLNNKGTAIILQANALEGYFILKEQTSFQYFNQGLPSWNGKAPHEKVGFKVQMRFPYAGSWSPWLTVGFWKNNIWTAYGTTSYAGGKIDYDWANIYTYINKWQFRVTLTRGDISQPSPEINKLSFFVSDSRTTSIVNIPQIVADNPAPIFIQTSFVYQYGVDPVIGGDICSPSTVSMILKSYNIPVDAYLFALSTRDPYYNMFGIWPRVVQNASEYGLDGAVTRYRTWSDARKVLENGGRIAMSIGKPLYTGHLVMLAGFTSDGKPIVHDPARSDGQAYVFDKTSISQSWFTKGGVSYTFYPEGKIPSDILAQDLQIPDDFTLYQNYPNPFNPATTIKFRIGSTAAVSLKVYDALGQEVATLVDETKFPGTYEVKFDGSNLSAGVYIYRLQVGSKGETKKLVLMK